MKIGTEAYSFVCGVCSLISQFIMALYEKMFDKKKIHICEHYKRRNSKYQTVLTTYASALTFPQDLSKM